MFMAELHGILFYPIFIMTYIEWEKKLGIKFAECFCDAEIWEKSFGQYMKRKPC